MIFLNILFKFQFNIYTFTVLIYIITIYEEITTIKSIFNSFYYECPGNTRQWDVPGRIRPG